MARLPVCLCLFLGNSFLHDGVGTGEVFLRRPVGVEDVVEIGAADLVVAIISVAFSGLTSYVLC